MPGSTPKPMPWSVKGVSDEAREIAKQAAAEHGMTIGDWLSTVIRVRTSPDAPADDAADDASDGGTTAGQDGIAFDDDDLLWLDDDDEDAAPSAAAEEPGPSQHAATDTSSGADAAAFEEAVKAAVTRSVAASEARVLQIVETLNDVVTRMADRLEVLEDHLAAREAEGAVHAIDAVDAVDEGGGPVPPGTAAAGHPATPDVIDEPHGGGHGAVIEEGGWPSGGAPPEPDREIGGEPLQWSAQAAAAPVPESPAPGSPAPESPAPESPAPVPPAPARPSMPPPSMPLPSDPPADAGAQPAEGDLEAPAGRWGRRHMRDPGVRT